MGEVGDINCQQHGWSGSQGFCPACYRSLGHSSLSSQLVHEILSAKLDKIIALLEDLSNPIRNDRKSD